MSGNNTVNNALFLQAPPGKRYVRSFFFSRRIDAPLARVHLLARVLLVVCLSSAQLRTIVHPDLMGACLLWLFSFILFLTSGMNARVARLYFLLTLPALLSLFLTWTLFNPIPGQITLVHLPVYSGSISIGLAWWQALWLGIIGAYYLWTRKIFLGLLLATVAAFAFARLFPLPEWTLLKISFFHQLSILVSDRGLLIAITKVIGYSGMVLSTIALVVTGRDSELIGALRQLRVPQPVIFFLSTVFRALDLALSDYDIIRQAQLARAVNARPRSFIRRLRDLSSIAVPMVAMMIRRSSEIGDALLARGYRLGQKSANFYETTPWRLLDWGVLVICLVLLYLALGPRVI
ncbi:energy-coupling factor transporter transmembrane protein EcfT [Ktedonosporobacter rubrisoli]|uniref:Energy-coupling factor transporter transmembrane protein EcfT n=1 Tax=Ktedonosporobacter rubrisoli TaxID=2509675 RepID=A0A4P6K510_KTERU|nr:energy-coupling factor transporter transmembrane component T [Ktedonosporobacter rubrisoli]QBD83165.1 energy-coupling factor transporter transmembrane protein EcfT [Ktedonosporobacter rubrisoli]